MAFVEAFVEAMTEAANEKRGSSFSSLPPGVIAADKALETEGSFRTSSRLRTIATAMVSALAVTLSVTPEANAWGRRGHALVNETAAYLTAERSAELKYLNNHAFDLGYYANVPDLIWKRPETYDAESPQHFMDLEIFRRELKEETGKALALDRATFDKTYPQVPVKAGRAYWRIRELTDRLHAIAETLKKADLEKKRRHELQADWLVTAGVIGHYVADLAQPLHVTENYDGQLTGQKGLHSFFEDAIVDAYAPGEIERLVSSAAHRKQAEIGKTLRGRPVLELLEELASASNKRLAEVLKIDKRVGRKNLRKARESHEHLLVESMALGAVYLAEIWSRPQGWTYDGNRFFNFAGTPEFIAPGEGTKPVGGGTKANAVPAVASPGTTGASPEPTPAASTPKSSPSGGK